MYMCVHFFAHFALSLKIINRGYMPIPDMGE